MFACVNKSGKIDYLEFRAPLPHQCWFAGETLWHFAALPAVVPSARRRRPRPLPLPYSHRLGPGRVRLVGVPVVVCVRIGVFVIVVHGDQPTGQLTGVRPC